MQLPASIDIDLDADIFQCPGIDAQTDRLARGLATIPGVGDFTASAIAATIPAVANLRSARDDATRPGLAPQPQPGGGNEKLGRISKAGNRYLRRYPFLGASCQRHAPGAMALISARRAGDNQDNTLARANIAFCYAEIIRDAALAKGRASALRGHGLLSLPAAIALRRYRIQRGDEVVLLVRLWQNS